MTDMSDPDFNKMSEPDLLDWLGDDAARWAKAFCHIKTNQGWDIKDIDENLMTTWFANAIEHAHRVRCERIDPVGGSARD